MGQRHQIYIRIHNPLKNKEVVKDLNRFANSEEIMKQAKKVFGSGKTSILPYHHQWLFGMTAAAVCHNIMTEVLKSDSPYHILSKDIDELPYPANQSSSDNQTKVDGFLNIVDRIINTQLNIEFAENGSRYGIQRAFSIINDAFDYETGKYEGKRSDCRFDFRMGDNNDGITIIDVVNKKYCFLNIGFGDSTVSKLSPFIPTSAVDYVKAYYPISNENLDEDDEPTTEKEIAENIEILSFVEKQFSNLELLSFNEVAEIFPLVYKEIEPVDTVGSL
jgi:hypothetical protein